MIRCTDSDTSATDLCPFERGTLVEVVSVKEIQETAAKIGARFIEVATDLKIGDRGIVKYGDATLVEVQFELRRVMMAVSALRRVMTGCERIAEA